METPRDAKIVKVTYKNGQVDYVKFFDINGMPFCTSIRLDAHHYYHSYADTAARNTKNALTSYGHELINVEVEDFLIHFNN